MGNEKCVDITDKKGCERKSCTWLITDEPEDCIVDVTTTETPTIEPGCCKADSVKREEMCLARDTREKCEKSSSCVGWISGNDADCSFEETTTESPGCCYINPEMAYSKKYQETCIAFQTERECLMLEGDDGVKRCVFEPMNEYFDCEALWPTTTETPTEPAGCCHGDLTSYKANQKCVGIADKKGCERKSCSWLITDDEDDCIVTTTTTETPTVEPGCCKGTTDRRCSTRCRCRACCSWPSPPLRSIRRTRGWPRAKTRTMPPCRISPRRSIISPRKCGF